jgi:hypothetical protein
MQPFAQGSLGGGKQGSTAFHLSSGHVAWIQIQIPTQSMSSFWQITEVGCVSGSTKWKGRSNRQIELGTQEVKEGGSQVGGQPGLHSNTLSQKTKKKKNRFVLWIT